MSSKYDEDEIAQMAGLGPLDEGSRPDEEVETPRVEGQGELTQWAGLGPRSQQGRRVDEAEKVPTKVARKPPMEVPSQVTIPFRDALVITGVSRNTLYSLLSRKAIPGARKLGGTWRFHHQTLLDWLACK